MNLPTKCLEKNLNLIYFIKATGFLKRVGIPLYNAMVKGFKYGAYLKDPMPRKKGFAEKFWLTFGYLSKKIY